MGLYDWNRRKARQNAWKNDVTFPEAETVLLHPDRLEMFDEIHSEYEPRTVTIGWSNLGRLLVVITSEGGRRRPRIISAWRATKRERNAYVRRQL
ncbi:MAG TPA: BrnT family toxin [Terriglobales bacterium]|nr:BrnT family toxin [Terriglobales bacterium]